MNVERWLPGAAGFYVLLGASPAHHRLRCSLFLTGFVGLNLAQSGLANWGPMISILRKPDVESRSGKRKEESGVQDEKHNDNVADTLFDCAGFGR
jgi:hypothetical protein